MAGPGPELIFVAGPQRGERAAVLNREAVAGRSPSADVQLAEEFASRQHARFALTGDGWLVEVLSPNGLEVNGKRYKQGKKLLLATGDVLGFGQATLVLFVSPQDDPEQALADYHAAHPEPAAPTAPAPEPEPEAPGEGEAPEAKPGAEPAPPKPPSKVRRYALILGVSALSTVLLILLASSMTEDKANKELGQLRRLHEAEIRKILETRLEKVSNPAAAAQSLHEAKILFEDRHLRTGDLYRCTLKYRLHLSYRNSLVFEDYRDGENCQKALDELVKIVSGKYHTAWANAKSKNWKLAADGFEDLLRVLPADEREDPVVYEQLLKNIRSHLALVKKYVPRR
ncbi:MAG TPA: FHA domain-containing protein [Phycisphaerae bacterium]|nr:FHA domain-containing protein [Phycisphaerae bacterium]